MNFPSNSWEELLVHRFLFLIIMQQTLWWRTISSCGFRPVPHGETRGSANRGPRERIENKWLSGSPWMWHDDENGSKDSQCTTHDQICFSTSMQFNPRQRCFNLQSLKHARSNHQEEAWRRRTKKEIVDDRYRLTLTTQFNLAAIDVAFDSL